MSSVALTGIISAYPFLGSLLGIANRKKEFVPGDRARELGRKTEIKSIHSDIGVITHVQWHNQIRFLITITIIKYGTQTGDTFLCFSNTHTAIIVVLRWELKPPSSTVRVLLVNNSQSEN